MLTRGGPLVVGLGESLFDSIAGEQFLGGAPLNFAVHVHGLLAAAGGVGVVASRVGDDPLGQRLLDELGERGLDTEWIQKDSEAPTGVVEVTRDFRGGPRYEIQAGSAWDRIEFTPELADLASRCAAVCFGTLAQRSRPSRATIQAFLDAAPQAIRIFDANLRQSYFDAAVVEASLQKATVLKCNSEELPILCGLLGFQWSDDGADQLVVDLAERFNLRAAAVTRGAEGTSLFLGDACYRDAVPKFAREREADSVGAGDACGAAIAAGLLLDSPPQEIVRLANLAGAYVASRRGATPPLPTEIFGVVRG